MMKQILFTLLFGFLFILPSFADSPKVMSPINIGSVLVDDISTEKMADTCFAYKMEEVDSEDGFRVFVYEDGSKIKCKVNKSEKGNIPVVQVIYRGKPGEIKKALSDTGFTKENDGYYKGSKFTQRRTKCEVFSGHPTIIIFTKVYNSTSD